MLREPYKRLMADVLLSDLKRQQLSYKQRQLCNSYPTSNANSATVILQATPTLQQLSYKQRQLCNSYPTSNANSATVILQATPTLQQLSY